MKDFYRYYLFDRHYLVSETWPETFSAQAVFSSEDDTSREKVVRSAEDMGTAEDMETAEDMGTAAHEAGVLQKEQFDILFSLAHFFNIRIVRGRKLVQRDMIRLAQVKLGMHVPEPFYKGFPASVRQLSRDQLIFDQLVHYAVTYGLGDFSAAGHSIFEDQFERTAFQENADITDYEVITEDEAVSMITEAVGNLLAGTRPLNAEQYQLVWDYIEDYDYVPDRITSKDTCVKLLLDTRDLQFADHLYLSDVIRFVDLLNYQVYHNKNLKKLNLRNQDRKFVTALIDRMFEQGRVDIRNCFEKKKIWTGLLHHIHYTAKDETAASFLGAMRGDVNHSVYAEFEKAMTERNIRAAALALKSGKGSAAVLRNLNYLISRCRTAEEIQYVLSCIDSRNTTVLIQQLIQYSRYKGGNLARTFKFNRYNKLVVHEETRKEQARRRSAISEGQAAMLADNIADQLRRTLKNRLGKVYIDPAMKNYAVPMQEGLSHGGYGTLTRGSRIHLPEGKKLRAFTYWEKVDDIDLSVFGLDEKGGRTEFSWRTMADLQSAGIVFSGDETSGYNGGSEYFDIDTEKFRKAYPHIHYLVFCNNVYSGIPFAKCFCKAGYMTRDLEDSGQAYEPKTVKSSFMVDGDTTFAYLFGLDLITNDFVWLNMDRNSSEIVAGNTSMDFLLDYFHVTEIINVYTLFEMMAEKLVPSMDEADVVVTDQPVTEREGLQIIREYDTEKITALMNQ